MSRCCFGSLCSVCATQRLLRSAQPKVFKLGFISSLSGPLAQSAETQKQAVELFVEQINAKGGLNMPWGKVNVEMLVKDDEMKLDVGVRRFRELVEAGCHAVTGSIYNPMSAALNEECKVTGTVYMPGCVPASGRFQEGRPCAGHLFGRLHSLEHRLSPRRCPDQRIEQEDHFLGRKTGFLGNVDAGRLKSGLQGTGRSGRGLRRNSERNP